MPKYDRHPGPVRKVPENLSNYDHANGTQSTRPIDWRREQLQAVGCDLKLADCLAEMRGLDLHEFVDLVKRGATPLQAARILLPDDMGLLGLS